MIKENNEKLLLEKSACDSFVASYNNLNGAEYYISKHQDKPDFILKDRLSGMKIGVEIAHLFYDENEAKLLLGRLKNKSHGLMSSNELIEKLNQLIKTKSKKALSYEHFIKLLLAIRVASPIFNKETFDLFESDILVNSNVFNEIYLLFIGSSSQVDGELKKLK